jgi:hypothetical protein
VNGIHHPFTGALYERDDDRVRVTRDGATGLFTSDGRWISGDLREADPQLCGWVGGRRVTSQRISGV